MNFMLCCLIIIELLIFGILTFLVYWLRKLYNKLDDFNDLIQNSTVEEDSSNDSQTELDSYKLSRALDDIQRAKTVIEEIKNGMNKNDDVVVKQYRPCGF